ncbi:MAG: family 43 glycosylhydrolase [Arachidicoccus sp.]|nr:family 43 glycosylhydrolase [Arachidicoccus sp.]
MKIYLTLLLGCIFANMSSAQFVNFTKEGKQIVRLDNAGNAVDSHDGKLAYFNSVYYLYGTSYDCGFEWQNKKAAFCGFKAYSSKDLKHWKDEGFLFDANTDKWQCRCNGATYGCFRPHVVYNKKTKKYVLWINSYDNTSGYHVLVSDKPIGPFKEMAEPKLAINAGLPPGLNNGDHDVFVDDNGTAYLAYTDWKTRGSIVIEKLSDDYLTGTGEYVKSVTSGATEAPGLFKRKGIYYVLYSDPNCGYCGGTGTSYKTASSPLGPWSEAKKINDNSCGGQPSFVSVLKYNADTLYVYGSDLWNNGAKNESLANYFWTPLSFDEEGNILAIDCSNKSADRFVTEDTSNEKIYSLKCDIANNVQHMQSFTVKSSGKLEDIVIPLFKNNHPNENLIFEVYKTGTNNFPSEESLFRMSIDSNILGWSAKNIVIHPNVQVNKNDHYAFVLRSDATLGSYGFVYHIIKHNFSEKESISKDGGKTYSQEPQQSLKFSLHVNE